MSDKWESKFWVILNLKGMFLSHSVRFKTYKDAEEAAKEEARLNPGETYVIMASQVAFVVGELNSITYLGSDGKPPTLTRSNEFFPLIKDK